MLGSASAELGPYEALGRGFSATPEFRAKYGDAADSAFVSQAYLDIFGSAPSDAQKASLNSQLSFFEKLYAGNGFAPAQAELQARGAVLGQIIGYAAGDTREAHHANADVVLTGIANGDTSHYGAMFG